MPAFITSLFSLVALNLPFAAEVAEESGINTEHLVIISNFLVFLATIILVGVTVKLIHTSVKDMQKIQAEENADIQRTTRLLLRVVRALGLANTDAKHRSDV